MASKLNSYQVTYKSESADSSVRDLYDKLNETISIKDFGAVGDGVTDDTAAVQAAADAATTIAADFMQYGAFSNAPTAMIYIPAGNFLISSQITSTAQLVWNLHPNAVISAEYLTGVVKQEGKHINAKHTGRGENSTTLSLRANTDLDNYSGVYSFGGYDTISGQGAPHSVVLQIIQRPPDYITLTGTTYTATSVTYTNDVDLSNVKTAATITSQGSTQHTGVITNVNQATKTITVEAWRPYTGTAGDVGTPTNGDDATIDYYRTVWGQNSDIFLKASNPTTNLLGYEMTVRNELADAPVIGTSNPSPSVRGFFCRNFGPYKGSIAFQARATSAAPWRAGFVSSGAENGVIVLKHEVHSTDVGVSYRAENGIAFESKISDTNAFSVSFDGKMELGRIDSVSQTTYINFHSSGNSNTFDSRIESVGGSATNGNGTLSIFANTTKIGRSGGHCLEVEGTTASVNYVKVIGGASGTAPQIQVQGSDANLDVILTPKGTGTVRFGSWTSNADAAVNGYVTIKDSSGNTRKLATIA